MFCTVCGAQNAEGARFCVSCGQTIPAAAPSPLSPPPTTAEGFVPPDRVEVRIGDWISRGWNVISSDLLLFAGATAVSVILSGLVPFILQGALIAGMQIMCMNKIRTGRTEFGDLFKGFNNFVPCLLVALVSSVFVFAGTLVCLIPGLVVAAMYMFPYLFIVDRKMEFWPAMQASHAVVKKNYLGFTLFFLSMIGIMILGVLACIIGILVAIPLGYAAVAVAYQDLVGFASPDRNQPV